MAEKKILLIGGTGFIGKALLKKFEESAENFQIKILSRHKKSSSSSKIDYLKGDLLDLNSLIEAVKEADIIIQSAQFPGHPVERPWLGPEYTYEGLDGQGTLNVLEAIKYSQRTNQIKQYIYLSGAGAKSSGKDYPWLKAKRTAENGIISSGIPYTIMRPSWVYGKGDRSMSKFILFAKYLPFFPIIGDGTATVNPVWVDDLAQILFNAIGNPKAMDKTITIGSKELNMKEVAKTVLKAVGTNKPIVCHPKPLMKLAGVFAQFIPDSPLSPGSVEFLTMEVHLKDLAESILGVRIKNLDEGLRTSGLV